LETLLYTMYNVGYTYYLIKKEGAIYGPRIAFLWAFELDLDISIPIITRLFQPGEYGNYVLVISTVSVISVIVGWLSIPIIRFYPLYEHNKKLPAFYGTILTMTFISIIILTCIFVIILLFLKSNIFCISFVPSLVKIFSPIIEE